MTRTSSRSAGRSPSELFARFRASTRDHPPFVEGLMLGALVGAAIAGSTLWARIREARRLRDEAGGMARPSQP